MSRLPTLISILLVIAAASAIAVLNLSPSVGLTTFERIQATTAIIATTGALISAAFVVTAYRQSIRTFQEAYRPQLLIQAESQFEIDETSGQPTPITIFRYRNISQYQFNDLTLHVTVHYIDKEVALDDLFPAHMTMPGQDHRFKQIRPVPLINERGLFINREVTGQPPPGLLLGYEYTYAGTVHRVNAQRYAWNVTLQLWEVA